MRVFTLACFFVLALCTALRAQNYTPYYEVKFPDDITVYGCGAAAPVVMPEITYYSACPFNVGISFTDQVFSTSQGGSCYKILRQFRLIYWCDHNANLPFTYIPNWLQTDVGPTVFGDSDNRGALEYYQIIKVLDTVPPVFTNCPVSPVTFCDYSNNDPAQYHTAHQDLCEGAVNLSVTATDVCSGADLTYQYRLYLDLDGNGSMETFISSGTPGAWPILTTQIGNTLQARIGFPAGYELPYGTHKVEWIVGDNCGNDAVCKYDFIVKDCKAPTVTCLNGLSINIMPTGMVMIDDFSFLLYTTDNCTPQNQLAVAIRKSGTGTGFPVGQQSVTFTCDEIGVQPVEIWSRDAAGNADFCLTYIDVQDHQGICVPPSGAVQGVVVTDAGQPLGGVALKVMPPGGAAPLGTAMTDTSGAFAFSAAPLSCSYSVEAALDTLPKAGVNTLDALLLAGHLAGLWPLETPYRALAADADRSGTLGNDDILEIVRLVLGLQPHFTNNESWRFVPANFVFPDENAPLQGAVPAAASLCMPAGGSAPAADFIGVKVGDLNGSGMPAANRSAETTVYFSVPPLAYAAGEEVRVPVWTPDLDGLAGFQFTLEYDLPFLELLAIEPGIVPAEWSGAFAADGRVTASWHSAALAAPGVPAAEKNQREVAFTLVFRALQEGGLERNIAMSSEIVAAEAYTAELRTRPAALNYDGDPTAGLRPRLLPVQPNPARDRVRAAFFMPQAGEATLRLVDATGQAVATRQMQAAQGRNEVEFDLQSRKGTLFLQLQTAGEVAVQRFLSID